MFDNAERDPSAALCESECLRAVSRRGCIGGVIGTGRLERSLPESGPGPVSSPRIQRRRRIDDRPLRLGPRALERRPRLLAFGAHVAHRDQRDPDPAGEETGEEQRHADRGLGCDRGPHRHSIAKRDPDAFVASACARSDETASYLGSRARQGENREERGQHCVHADAFR